VITGILNLGGVWCAEQALCTASPTDDRWSTPGRDARAGLKSPTATFSGSSMPSEMEQNDGRTNENQSKLHFAWPRALFRSDL